MNRNARGMIVWLVLVSILVFASYQILKPQEAETYDLPFSEFLKLIDDGKIARVYIGKEWIDGEFIGKQPLPVESGAGIQTKLFSNFRTRRDPYSNYPLEQKLEEKGVTFFIEPPSAFPQWVTMLLSGLLPVVLFIAVMIFISRQMQGAGNKALSFGKSKARRFSESHPRKTFEDVAGCEEAKEELREVVDFLRDPKKYQRLGGRIPKGVLLVGRPGTGKTLLARAVAGEAGVPFFSISGSDFVEMFVGVGASRVRDLFETGRKNAPCIIFIDELDAVGRYRGAGIGGGHDEREQTLNQLLVEISGFDSSEGVIVLAATNRPDILDPALLRPGRFDRQVVVDLPDVKGRAEIFKIYLKNVKADPKVLENVDTLAKGTPYFSGADIENMVNEAALIAARRNKEFVDLESLDEAKDKVMMGPERKSMLISESEKRILAYHEAGHALVAHMLPEGDPNYKCSIIPRGRALGVTQMLPVEERHIYSRAYLLAEITIRMGGRAAEDLIFGEPTTGAENDLKGATKRAKSMVCEWGMSDKLGPATFGEREEQIFLGKELAHHQDYSEQTAIEIDEEIKKILYGCYERAKSIIQENIDKLHTLAETLLDKEVLDAEELNEILGPPPQPKKYPIGGINGDGAETEDQSAVD